MTSARTIIDCVITLPKLAMWKLRYGSRFSASWKSSLKKNTEIRLSKEGRIILGEKIVAMNGLALSCRGKLQIGRGCFFNQNCSITSMEQIVIGDHCTFANNVVIVDHDHDYKNDINQFITEPVQIGDYVWIGANTVVLRGVEIGAHSVIAAGSVVRTSVPANTLYYETRTGNCKEVVPQND